MRAIPVPCEKCEYAFYRDETEDIFEHDEIPSDLGERIELTVFGPAPMIIASPEGGILAFYVTCSKTNLSKEDDCVKCSKS